MMIEATKKKLNIKMSIRYIVNGRYTWYIGTVHYFTKTQDYIFKVISISVQNTIYWGRSKSRDPNILLNMILNSLLL